MKRLLMFSLIMVFATAAFSSEMFSGKGTGESDTINRDMFYCQPPIGMAFNASTAFDAELADDVPDALNGQTFNQVGFNVLEWGSTWMNPTGCYVNIYLGECPPTMNPDTSYYFLWADLAPVYQNLDGYDTYYCTATLPDTWTISEPMSIGFVVDNSWGQNAPYCGVATTNFDAWYGDCVAYWAGDYWGFPRWSSASAYGYNIDVGFCLGLIVTPAEESDWSTLKSLY